MYLFLTQIDNLELIIAAVLLPLAVALIVVLLLLLAAARTCRKNRGGGYAVRYAISFVFLCFILQDIYY